MKKIIDIWFDSTGKKQYRYNPDYTKLQSEKKFRNISRQAKNFDIINKKISQGLKSKDIKKKEIAMILYIMIHCGFRIGNKVYEKNYNSYGISTIKLKHISIIKPGTIKFDFIGKKGIRNIDICSNNIIYEHIVNKLEHGGKNSYLFECATSKDVNDFLKQYGNISSKDLRTKMANILFLKYCVKNHKIDGKNVIKHSFEYVSKKLHNTPAICKKSYIDSKLVQHIEEKLKNDDIKL